jgi:ribonuclease I
VNQQFDLRIFSKKKELFRDINDPELKRELADGQTQLISNIEIE